MLSGLINTTEQRTLSLTTIRRDGGTQPRDGIDWEHVKEMQQALANGAALPAVDVIYDGTDYWLWDGFHRFHAYANVGKLEIPVAIQQGTQDDAQWQSLAANQNHGLKRTKADKERAIRAALKHPKSAGLSNLAIARHLGVDDKTVAKYREEMELSSEIPKIDERIVERNGQTYTQNTANIGANRPASAPAQRMAEQYTITPIVHGVVRQRNATAADLRMTARNRSGAIWQECLAAVPAGHWVAHRDLAQALHNVAYDMELRAANEAAKAAPVGHVSNVTEPAIENAAPPAAALPAWASDDAEPAQPAPPAGKLLVDYTEEDWEAATDEQTVFASVARLADIVFDYIRRKFTTNESAMPFLVSKSEYVLATLRQSVSARREQYREEDLITAIDKVIARISAATVAQPLADVVDADGEVTLPPVELPPHADAETRVAFQRAGRASTTDLVQKHGYGFVHNPTPPYGDGAVELLHHDSETRIHRKLGVFATDDEAHQAARRDLQERIALAVAPAADPGEDTLRPLAPPDAEPVEALPVSQRADYESDEWYTPAEYIDAARQVMGAIDLDPASSELAQTVVKATVYLTRFDDGLRQVRWLHQRIWLNPPYSNPGPWIEKLIREHQAGPYCTEALVLVNNATETAWFQALLQRFPACFPAKRIAFWRHDHANVGARQGQAFFYLGPHAAKFQEIFSQFGPILRRLP